MSWFSRKPSLDRMVHGLGHAHEELQLRLRTQKQQLDDVREELDRLSAAFRSFRGQVYAWRGKLELQETPPPSPPPVLPLSDPRVPKDEVFKRLGIKPGARVDLRTLGGTE